MRLPDHVFDWSGDDCARHEHTWGMKHVVTTDGYWVRQCLNDGCQATMTGCDDRASLDYGPRGLVGRPLR